MKQPQIINSLTTPQLVEESTKRLSLLSALYLLLKKMSLRRQLMLLPLLLLMLIGAIAELFTLGALFPFLSALSGDQGSTIVTAIRPFLEAMGATTSQDVNSSLAGLFALAVVLASLLRLLLVWAVQKFVFGVSCELGVKLYADTLSQPYVYHTQHNNSEIISSIAKVEMVTNLALMPIMTAAVATVIAMFIVAGLIILDPFVAILSGGTFIGAYLLASLATRPSLRRNAVVIARAQGARVQSMQEGLGGIRDILIDGSQPFFVETYARAETEFSRARSRNAFLSNAPRFVVEGAGMALIALVAVIVVNKPGGFSQALPVLGVLALGAQRLLPLIQQIYFGWANATGNKQNLLDILALLRRSEPIGVDQAQPLPFSSAITLRNVSYTYAARTAHTIRDVCLEIPKGSRIGIVGKTGSGKSTLVDLILGLLEPTTGVIEIDGIVLTDANRAAWQRNIAHVPQFIFLADTSITQNIAFGVKTADINMALVHQAASYAELDEVIRRLPEGYNTRVGERGIQLSGGQRQRIGIARALYKQASVLILDEATSALDGETETAIMKAISHVDRRLTVIMIAHRLSTLLNCDTVLQVEEGRITNVRRQSPSS